MFNVKFDGMIETPSSRSTHEVALLFWEFHDLKVRFHRRTQVLVFTCGTYGLVIQTIDFSHLSWMNNI